MQESVKGEHHRSDLLVGVTYSTTLPGPVSQALELESCLVAHDIVRLWIVERLWREKLPADRLLLVVEGVTLVVGVGSWDF